MTTAHDPMKEIISLQGLVKTNLAHPMTGVRLAQKISAPLRSSIRLHAQAGGGDESLEHANPHRSPMHLVYRQDAGIVTIYRLTVVHDYLLPTGRHLHWTPGTNLSSKLGNMGKHSKNVCRNQLRQRLQKQAPQYFCGLFNAPQLDPRNGKVEEAKHVIGEAIYRYSSLKHSSFSQANKTTAFLMGLCFSPLTISLVTSLRNPNSRQDRTDRADSLHPGSTRLARVHRQHYDVSGRKDQNSTRHRDLQVLLCPSPAALITHPYHLKAKENQSRLQAPRQHVQRGAA